jgi:formylglycine-generating enzyme required for sulfatase activity
MFSWNKMAFRRTLLYGLAALLMNAGCLSVSPKRPQMDVITADSVVEYDQGDVVESDNLLPEVQVDTPLYDGKEDVVPETSIDTLIDTPFDAGECIEGKTVIAPCGYNAALGRGKQLQECIGGEWINVGDCIDNDLCTAGTEKPCDLNPAALGFVCQLVGDVYQFVNLASEDSGQYPDGIDNDCNGIIDDNFHVYIPAGSVILGCSNDITSLCNENLFPPNVADLPAFHIDRFEITEEQYLKCVQNNGACDSNGITVGSNLPVTDVTYAMAEKYCAYAGGRIPENSEWVKAARGGAQIPDENGNMVGNPVLERIYPWGNSPDGHDPSGPNPNYAKETICVAGYANLFPDCNGQKLPVGSFPKGASPYGVMDMTGNVLEFNSGEEPLISGGSFTSIWGYISKTYLYFNSTFPDDSSLPDLGIRCVYDSK